MFHFGKKKASVPELVLSAENIELYRGPLSDIPLSEETILATCMDLYKDPQPCYIHRGAARQYLVAKLTDMITNFGGVVLGCIVLKCWGFKKPAAIAVMLFSFAEFVMHFAIGIQNVEETN